MIVECKSKHLPELSLLAQHVYVNSSHTELLKSLAASLQAKSSNFFIYIEDKQIIGFAEISIRHDYVEGLDQSPCGYLEGVFVKENHRQKGIARQLVVAGEAWSRDKGCRGFASDCHIDNQASLLFHQRLGFKEVSRNSHFVK